MELFDSIVKYLTCHQEWIIAIIGAVIGSILSIISTIFWDKHKNKNKLKDLLKTLFFELSENKKRVDSAVETLPKEIKDKIKAGDLNKGISLSDEEIAKLHWSFPKPYTVDAWKTLILSGMTVDLPSKLFQELYKIYDSIQSINYLSSLSISIFQILAQQNRLDTQMNKNFDQFCRFGTRSLEVMMSESINNAVDDLKRIIG